MSLYLDYRPDSFDKMVGNQETIQAISNLLKKGDKAPRAYLLHGLSGGGKTTLGRIIAKELGCHDFDLTEINSSDFRGIDMVRELREKMKHSPLQGKYRAFLIDECHQLTKVAQDAFLKLLEDTPKHVFIILCTTDPQMLKVAVRNRCQQFQVNPLTDGEMTVLLKTIAKKEKQKPNKKVIAEIVRVAKGSAREGIQTLERILAVPPEQQLELAKQGAKMEAQGIELCRALMASKPQWKAIAIILNGLKGEDAESIRRQVLGYAQAILLKGNFNKQAALVLEEFNDTTYNSGFPALTLMCASVFNNS